MPIEYMRTKVMEVYPGPKWAIKVQHMPTRQIVALYNKFKSEGRFEPKYKKQQKINDGVQLTFFDTNRSAMEVL